MDYEAAASLPWLLGPRTHIASAEPLVAPSLERPAHCLWNSENKNKKQVISQLLNLNLCFVAFYPCYSSQRIKQNITENCSSWYTRWREETLAVGVESKYITNRYKHLINRTNKHSEIISYTINNNWRVPAHTTTVGRVMPLITYLVQASQQHNYFCKTFSYPHKTDINFNLNVFACSVRSEWAENTERCTITGLGQILIYGWTVFQCKSVANAKKMRNIPSPPHSNLGMSCLVITFTS